MEQIRKAVELARATAVGTPRAQARYTSPGQSLPPIEHPSRQTYEFREVELNLDRLEQHRIVAHDPADPRSKPYDMLRTHVLRSLHAQHGQLIAIASPTPGCGKTVTAINLALSIASQPDQSVLLVDLDLRKPNVSNYLSLTPDKGVNGLLSKQILLQDAVLQVRTRLYHFLLLPVERAIAPSTCIPLVAKTNLLQELRQAFPSHLLIVDMPPMLASDELLALSGKFDSILLVVAAGHSTLAEVNECSEQLRTNEVLRIVLNKAPMADGSRYY